MFKQKKDRAGCETCANRIPIDDGNYICFECDGSDKPAVLVLDDYNPTNNYLKCEGKKYERK